MNTAHLLRAIGDVDVVFVDVSPIEDHIRKRKRITWIKGVSVAACLLIVVCCIQNVYPQNQIVNVIENKSADTTVGEEQQIVYPSENTPPDATGSPVFLCAHAFNLENHTYKTLADKSELVLVADVIDVQELNLPIFMMNHVSVRVRDVLKGDVTKGDVLFVEDLTSFEFGHIPGVPMMQCGNRVLLFLVSQTIIKYDSENESAKTYGFVETYPHLGRFFLDRDGKYHEADTYGERFPWPYSDELFEDYTPKTLEEIKELIEVE